MFNNILKLLIIILLTTVSIFFIHTFRYEHISHNYYGFGQDIIIRFDRLFPNKEPCIIQDANSILLYNEGYNLYLLYCD